MYAVTQSYLDAVRASSRTDRLTGDSGTPTARKSN